MLNWAWLEACLELGHAAGEDAFEVGEDTHGPTSGPILARLSMMEANPRMLSGWQVSLGDAHQGTPRSLWAIGQARILFGDQITSPCCVFQLRNELGTCFVAIFM